MPIKHVSILGVGLLGGSIGLALRKTTTDCTISGYGHRASTLASAVKLGAIDRAFENPQQAVADADLVILCTPVGIFESLLQSIAPALKPGAIVTDVGSTKRSIVEAAGRLMPAGVHFVASHPIAGSEKRGVEFARADLFTHALCLITPTDQTDPQALETVCNFWKSLGMHIQSLSPTEHDQLLADVSHLPHAVASALVAMQTDHALSLAGKGFLDATRIAAGDGPLWRDILLDNRDQVKAGLHRLIIQLTQLEAWLDSADATSLTHWLTAAANRRQAAADSTKPKL